MVGECPGRTRSLSSPFLPRRKSQTEKRRNLHATHWLIEEFARIYSVRKLTFINCSWALLRVCASGTGHSAPPVSPDTGQDFPLFPQRPRQFPQLRTPATFESVARHFRLTGFRLRSGGPYPRFPSTDQRRLPLPAFRGPAVHQVGSPIVCLAIFRFPAPVRGRPPGGRC